MGNKLVIRVQKVFDRNNAESELDSPQIDKICKSNDDKPLEEGDHDKALNRTLDIHVDSLGNFKRISAESDSGEKPQLVSPFLNWAIWNIRL